MCGACYRTYTEDGVPEMTSEMEEIVTKIKVTYDADTPWAELGGPLHVQIDDMNVMDSMFDDKHAAQLTAAIADDYPDMTPSEATLFFAIFDGLRLLTPAQRAVCVWNATWGRALAP